MVKRKPIKRNLSNIDKKTHSILSTILNSDKTTPCINILKYNDIKHYLFSRYVSFSMIVNLNINIDSKIELLKLSTELNNIETTEYIDKYIKLWNKYNNYVINGNSIYKCINDKYNYLYELLKTISLSDKHKHSIHEKLILLSNDNEETIKSVEQLQFILTFPWNVINTNITAEGVASSNKQKTILATELTNVKNELNNKLYGMDECKMELLRHIMKFKLGKKMNAIALCGPPGIGKTVLLQELGKILNVPIKFIQCGCITDISYIQGHSITYINSQPGIIASAIHSAKCLNLIIVLDELDKLFDTTQSAGIINQFIHLLDIEQHAVFCDNYIGDIPINLSNIMFVCTLNDHTKLSNILKDRLKIIELNGYNLIEKKIIIKKYIFPKIIINSIFNLTIDDKTIDYIINKKLNNNTEQCGIRYIERFLNELIDKLQYNFLYQSSSNSIKLTIPIINSLFP